MRKRIILRLLLLIAFSISLYSCIHDDMSSATDPSPKEYTNKSLWKEDEKYIHNVKKVFDQYADKNYFSGKYGNVLWDYALTMGTFDESFLEVPISRNGKINSVLTAERRGDRVFFKIRKEKSSNDFFDVLVFKDRSQLKGNIISGNGDGTSSKTTCRTVTVTWTWTNETTGEVIDSYVFSETTCTSTGPVVTGPTGSSDCLEENCTGGGTGGGGYPYPSDTTNPCERTKELVSKQQVQDSLISLKNHALTNTKDERGFQELKSGTLQSGAVTAGNQIFFGIGSNSLGTVHTHQPGTIGILAPQDIMTFLHIVGQQDPNSLGNAYSGTVSSSGTYFIYFTGTASDLPPAMTDVQEAAYVADLVKAYKEWEDFLSEDERYSTNFLKVNKPLGLEILLFKLLKKMNLDDKIQLIKEENGNTSTINENVNGTTTPNPC